MSENARESRFADLAVELLGSKLAAELVREIWTQASDEVKEQLANAVLVRMIADLNTSDVRWVIEGEIRRAALEKLKASPELEQRAAEAVGLALQKVDEQVARAAREAVEEICTRLQRKMLG